MIVLVVLMASSSIESTVTKVSDVVVEEIVSQTFEKKSVDNVIGDAMLLEELIAEVEAVGTISPLKVGCLAPADVECSRRTTTTLAAAGGTDFKSAKPTCYIFGKIFQVLGGAQLGAPPPNEKSIHL